MQNTLRKKAVNFTSIINKLHRIIVNVHQNDIEKLFHETKVECLPVIYSIPEDDLFRLTAISKLTLEEREFIRGSREFSRYQVGLHDVKNTVAKYTTLTGKR
jgi:hypothetical protein